MTIRSYQLIVQALVSPASGSTINRSATTNLGLTTTADPGPVFWVSAETALNLTVEAQAFTLPGGTSAVVTDLNLTHEALVHGYEYPVTELGLTHLAEASFPTVKSATTGIFLVSSAEAHIGVINKTATTDLGLTVSANIAFSGVITQSLGLEQRASWTDIFQDIGLTQTVEWGFGYEASNQLNLVHFADRQLGLNRGTISDNILDHAVAYFVESACSKKQFESWHGLGGVAPADKKLNYTNTFHIVSLDDGTVVTLRNPETDDRRRYAFDRVNRKFFDGTTDVYADDNWVTEETQIYTIVASKREQLDEVHDFLQANLGREILIKDWKGVSWIVIVTNPGELYTEDREGYWTIDFEVVGEAVDGEYVVQRLNLMQDPSRAGSIYGRTGLNTDILTSRSRAEPQPVTPLGITTTATFVIE